VYYRQITYEVTLILSDHYRNSSVIVTFGYEADTTFHRTYF